MHHYINRLSSERLYSELYAKIKSMAGTNAKVIEGNHPIIIGARINNGSKYEMFLSGGVHGDEIAGIHALMEFIPKAKEYTSFNFTVLPCINPVGYEKNIRESSESYTPLDQFVLPHRKD